MLVVLTFFRVTSWMRHHPLLAQMYKQDHDRADADTVFDPVGLRAVIVRHYLPKEKAESLLTRLEDTKHRTLNLLEPNDHSGTEG